MVDAVAILFLVQGLFNLACAALLLIGGAILVKAGNPRGMPELDNWYSLGGVLVGFLALVVVLFGLPDLIAAHGIRHRRYWGYVLGLVLAGLHCLWALASIYWHDVCGVVVNGACGIFVLVVLLNSRYAAEFS